MMGAIGKLSTRCHFQTCNAWNLIRAVRITSISPRSEEVFGVARLRPEVHQSTKIPAFILADLAYFPRVTLTEQMTLLARQAKAASRDLAKLTTAEKNACLLA